MGKAKSAKKSRQQTSNQPTPKAGSNSITALEADLASLEEGKRQKACMLLADLYAFNITNKYSLEALTSSNILSKLSMRLVDTSVKVRVEGAGALKNLSESKNEAIIKRLINLGIIRSAVTLCVEIFTGSNLNNPDSISFVENLLHTLANAISCCSLTMNEIISTNKEFLSGLFTMINTNISINILSAVINLLIIVTSNCHNTIITGNETSLSIYQTRMEQIWTFIEFLNSMKNATMDEILKFGLFASKPVTAKSEASTSTTASIDQQETLHQQYLFQLNVLMIECLEVIVSIYTYSQNTSVLAETCRINRALLLLNLELHTSLHGIHVVASTSNTNTMVETGTGRKNSCVSVDMDEDEGNGASVSGPDATTGGGSSGTELDPEMVANMRRLGLCKTISGVLSNIFETLSGETDTTSSPTATTATVDSERIAKSHIVGALIWEQQTYSTLLQCYNAAYYFVSASTTTTSTNTAIAITPAVVDGLECCDQVMSTLGQAYTLLVSSCPAQLRDSGLVDVSLFTQLLQPLLDLVNLTSPVTDSTSNDWKAPYYLEQGVTENAFRRSLLVASSSIIDFLTRLCRSVSSHTPPPSSIETILIWSEEELKTLALLLVRCSSFPNVEIAVPSILAMGVLGQRDFAIRENTNNQQGLLNPTLNALLTNALLRRLYESNAYSCDTIQQNKQIRLLEGSMQLMDSCMNAIIDLHTSDDILFLNNYKKLNCNRKLQESGEVFTNKLGSNTASTCMDQSDLEKFSETLENVESFIQYKAGFI